MWDFDRDRDPGSVRPEPFGSAQGRLRAASGDAESKGPDLELDPDLDGELVGDRDPDRARPDGRVPLRLLAAAGLLDAAIVAAATAPPILLAAWALPRGIDSFRMLLPAALALGALGALAYASLLHGLTGATAGDRLLGLAVVDGDGQTPSMGRAALRASLAIAGTAALGLGLLPALFTGSRRTLHDRVAGTFIVRAP